jgi:hypothetical protein
MVREERSHDPQRGQQVDSLHQGRESGFRAAQDEERGRGTRAGYTSEEEEIEGEVL